jgi:membrane protein DedA with SNARE-associated domain
MAGTVNMPYRRFLAFNAAGGLVWGLTFTTLGYLAGASYTTLENDAGLAGDVIFGVAAAALVGYLLLKVYRRRTRSIDDTPQAHEDPTDQPA